MAVMTESAMTAFRHGPAIPSSALTGQMIVTAFVSNPNPDPLLSRSLTMDHVKTLLFSFFSAFCSICRFCGKPYHSRFPPALPMLYRMSSVRPSGSVRVASSFLIFSVKMSGEA